MPVEYQLDPANGLIRTRCLGATTVGEVLKHLEDLAADPDCPGHLDVLLDLSMVTVLPKVHEIQQVSGALTRMRDRVRFGTCAAIATTDALYGMIRVFEIAADESFERFDVFRNARDAELWLKAHRTSI